MFFLSSLQGRSFNYCTDDPSACFSLKKKEIFCQDLVPHNEDKGFARMTILLAIISIFSYCLTERRRPLNGVQD
jgi:hypothetical protein